MEFLVIQLQTGLHGSDQHVSSQGQKRALLWAFHPHFRVVDREWEEIFQHWFLGLLQAKRLITLFAIKVDSLMLARWSELRTTLLPSSIDCLVFLNQIFVDCKVHRNCRAHSVWMWNCCTKVVTILWQSHFGVCWVMLHWPKSGQYMGLVVWVWSH